MQWENTRALVGPLNARSLVARVRNENECLEAIGFAQLHGFSICPKGAGFTYGDAILNRDNLLLDTSRMNRIISLDAESGQVVVEPGVRLIEIQKSALHRALFLFYR